MTVTFVKNFKTQNPRDYKELKYASMFSIENQGAIFNALNVEIKDSFIDVGCGTGQLAGYVQRTHPKCRVWGIDFSPERIKEAQRVYPKIKWICDDITDCRFKADLIALFEVLEHLPDPKKLLNNCSGIVIGSVPLNMPNPEHCWIFESKADVDDLLNPTWSVEEQGHVFFRCGDITEC